MQQYEPPRHTKQGSWREILSYSMVAWSIVVPVMAVILGIMALIAIALWLATVHPLLALIPVGLLAAGFGAAVLRDRRNQARLEAELAADPPRSRRRP
ncbi:MAG: hypothetical protein EXR63_05360 [Dehalococcoidia bacterium]|nr:hypothetical protein [Dehalococcoidia bacterium]